MSKPQRKYKSGDDVIRYLDDTLVVVDERYVYHARVASRSTLRFNQLYTTQPPLGNKPYNDPSIRRHNIKVGFVNYQNGCVLVSRTSGRIQKNGLSTRAVHSIAYYGDMDLNMYTKNFEDMILNKYPTFEQAWNKASGLPIASGCAFSRGFALVRKSKNTLALHLNTQEIGLFKISDGHTSPLFPIEDNYTSHLMKKLQPYGVTI